MTRADSSAGRRVLCPAVNRYQRERLLDNAVGVLMVVGALVAVTGVLTLAGRIVVGDEAEPTRATAPPTQVGGLPTVSEEERLSLLETIESQSGVSIEVAGVLDCSPIHDRLLCRVTPSDSRSGACLTVRDVEPQPGDRVRALCGPE